MQKCDTQVDAFFTKLNAQKTFEKNRDVFYEYYSYLYLIDWIQDILVFPFDKTIKLSSIELKEMILDSYVSFPDFSLGERRNYILGLSITRFVQMKVQAGYLCRDLQGEDIMSILSSLPGMFHNSEVLLGTKDGITISHQEYQYCKRKAV